MSKVPRYEVEHILLDSPFGVARSLETKIEETASKGGRRLVSISPFPAATGYAVQLLAVWEVIDE